MCFAYQSLLAPLERAGKLTLARVAGDVSEEGGASASSGNGHIFWIMFKSPSEREAAEAWMHKHGVQCCRHYVPLHLSHGGQRYARSVGDMRTTIKVGEDLLRLPLWYGMTWAHVHRVVVGLFSLYDLNPPSYKETLQLFSPEKNCYVVLVDRRRRHKKVLPQALITLFFDPAHRAAKLTKKQAA